MSRRKNPYLTCRYAEAKALCVYGQLHLVKGQPHQARERFGQALAILNHLGERLYAERIERALAKLSSLHESRVDIS